MVTKVGIVGLYSKDNGHPFSFSAIINGYKKKYFKKTIYTGILNYLEKRKKKEFGIKNFKVTHAWTQDKELTDKLCKSCKIKYSLSNYNEMVGKVDAVIIARDNLHYKIAKIFLQKNIPVFVDKPLSLNKNELNFFYPYLKSAKLMSTSGLRFSNEVKSIKKKLKKIGKVKFILANVMNNLENYGVHMLDIIDELGLLNFKDVKRLKKKNIEILNIVRKDDTIINLNCLGKIKKIFHIKIIGEKGSIEENFNDNFTSFKNTLVSFFKMCKKKKIQIKPKNTINIMHLIMLAKNLKKNENY